MVISSYTTNNGTYGDGTAYQLQQPNYTFAPYTPAFYSVRLAPQLVGLGLLEAVSESTLQALADADNADSNGIAGHLQTVTDPQTGQLRLGRFAYKAAKARVSHQIAGALNTDMGVTTSIFPILDGETNSGPVELSDSDLANWTRYVSCLGVNARRNLADPQCLLGEQLFTTANCVQCHVPTLTTSSYHPIAELRNQTIHPYTDLLLHDMGPGLRITWVKAMPPVPNGAPRLSGVLVLPSASAAARPICTMVGHAPSKRPSFGMTARQRPPGKPFATCRQPIALPLSLS